MAIDTSKLDPATASQVQMFESMADMMPTEALDFFIEFFTEKRAERGEN